MTFYVIFIFTLLLLPSFNFYRTESYSIKSELQRKIKGVVNVRGSPEYEISRPVHNGLCRDIYPLLIVKPFDTEDVASCVKIAVKYGIEISVRSGGHSYQCLGIKVSTIDNILTFALCSKSPIFIHKINLTKPQHFPEFFTQFFLTIFLVKSKLSTGKKSKTTTFSRVFHPKKSTIFLGNQS